MKKCLVMVATYNGEKYLREQLDSILAQQGVEVYVKVADDCSTDNTCEILSEYKQKHINFDYAVNEKNKRFTYNFLDLFFSVKEDIYDYYAFSDQDDFWLPDKLSKAIELIESSERNNSNGVLYCSNLKVVNADLQYQGMQEDDSIKKCNKRTFLFENIATGCTIVFDSAFKQFSQKYYPVDIQLHDYWLFLIAVYCATYVYDYNGYILYRQHGSNQIGSNKRKWTLANIKKFFKIKSKQPKLLSELIRGFEDDISPEDMQNMIIVRDYRKKLKYKLTLMFNRKFRKRRHNLIFKLKVMFNKL